MGSNMSYLEEYHAFNAFKNWHENLIIVDKPIKRDNVMFLPYVPVGRFKEATDVLGLDGIDVIFCHQEFKGCKLGAIISEHGDVWPETNPIVISGHIHERSVLGKNILYVGSPYQTSFGDPSKKSIELITITDRVSTKPIYLNMPQKITINVAASKFALYEFDLDPANYYRVNIEGDSETIFAIKKSKKYKELCETAKVVTKPSDKITVQRSLGRSFSQILADSIKDEDKEMQVLHEEVIRDAN
jgi:DNA repair exonuclease SbcCD nuclease subunit